MPQPDFNPAPVAVRIHRIRYVSRCKVSRCTERATTVAEKVDVAGHHVRQIELCDRHCERVIKRERGRGFEISDRRREQENETVEGPYRKNGPAHLQCPRQPERRLR